MACSSARSIADAGHLHLGQDAHQRRLDVVVQHDHVLGLAARRRNPAAMATTSHASPAASRATSRASVPGSAMSRVSWPVCSRSCCSPYSPVEASSRYAATAVSISSPVTSMPSGSSDRMASLTWCPTTARASTALSFLTTEAAPSRSPGTRTPEAGLLALGRHQHQPDQIAAPRHAVPAGGQGQPALPQLVDRLGGLGRRRGQRDVAQLERGPVRPSPRRRDRPVRRARAFGAGPRHCRARARPARRRRGAPPGAATRSSSRSARRSPRPWRGPSRRARCAPRRPRGARRAPAG